MDVLINVMLLSMVKFSIRKKEQFEEKLLLEKKEFVTSKFDCVSKKMDDILLFKTNHENLQF